MSDSEEEILVLVDLKKVNVADGSLNAIKFVGLETEKPIVKCEKQTFRGEWLESIGTKIFMAESTNTKPLDPAFMPELTKQYECWGTTNKVLSLTPFILNKREEDSEEEGQEEINDNENGSGSDAPTDYQSSDSKEEDTEETPK